MADSQSNKSSGLGQQPLQPGQAGSNLGEQAPTAGILRADADIGGNIEVHSEALKNRVDDAIPKGPKRADPSTGGRVMVAEEGDLHDLAARRQP